MTNTNLLKSKMIAAGHENFVADLAELLCISRTTASEKLHGKKPFSQCEITKISKEYGLSADDVIHIFILGAE